MSIVCASRSFVIPGTDTVLTFRFYSPRVIEDGSYRCEYQILVEDRVVRTFEAGGADSLQALLLAVTSAMNDLEFRFPDFYGMIPPDYLADMRRLISGRSE